MISPANRIQFGPYPHIPPGDPKARTRNLWRCSGAINVHPAEVDLVFRSWQRTLIDIGFNSFPVRARVTPHANSQGKINNRSCNVVLYTLHVSRANPVIIQGRKGLSKFPPTRPGTIMDDPRLGKLHYSSANMTFRLFFPGNSERPSVCGANVTPGGRDSGSSTSLPSVDIGSVKSVATDSGTTSASTSINTTSGSETTEVSFGGT